MIRIKEPHKDEPLFVNRCSLLLCVEIQMDVGKLLQRYTSKQITITKKVIKESHKSKPLFFSRGSLLKHKLMLESFLEC